MPGGWCVVVDVYDSVSTERLLFKWDSVNTSMDSPHPRVEYRRLDEFLIEKLLKRLSHSVSLKKKCILH